LTGIGGRPDRATGTSLEVSDLRITYPGPPPVRAVDGLSFAAAAGECLGVLGESGSGKSVTFMTVMGLVTRKFAHIEGQILFRGKDLLEMDPDDFRRIRGRGMGMVFQDPMSSLHPMYKVGAQISEAIRTHEAISKKEGFERAIDILRKVGIPKPDERARQFPHEFSGGMRQRAMIAMALVLNPDLLIADEPTTALDVTVQAQILDLIGKLREEFNTAVIMITHDLGALEQQARREARAPAPDQRFTAVVDLRSAGVLVPSALPLQVRSVRQGCSGVGRRRSRARVCVSPVPRRQEAHLPR